MRFLSIYLSTLALMLIGAASPAVADGPKMAPPADAGTTQPTSRDADADIVVHFDRPEAKVMFVLPAESRPVRGVLVHGPNMKREPSARWTALVRSMRWAHIVVSIDLKRNNRPRRLRENVPASLKQMADLLGRPELTRAPLAPTGHSAGGMTLSALAAYEDRLLTGANDCSWIYGRKKLDQQPHMTKTPLLFTIGAIPDAFKMIPAIERDYDPTRKAGAPWALGFEWGKAHSWANAGTLYASWFKAIDKLRIDDKKPYELKSVKVEEGWLGSRDDWDTTYATIARYQDYKGDKGKAVWLPDRAFAFTWRSYQSKASPWQLTAVSTDGKHKLAPFKLSKSHQLEVPAGQAITLGITGEKADTIKRVRWFHEDQVIGEASKTPWQMTWNPPPGAHPVHAEWTAEDGNVGVTNPALIVVMKKPNWKVIDLREKEQKKAEKE